MNSKITEAFLLTQEELQVLLQTVGCKSWYGFSFDERNITEDEAIHVIYHMVEKEFLYSDGVNLHVKKDLAEAARILKNSQEVFVLEDSENILPVYCCYIDEKVLICEWMSQRNNTVKLKVCERDQLFQTLEDEGYFDQKRLFSGEMFNNPSGKSEYKICNVWGESDSVLMYEDQNKRATHEFDIKWIRNFFENIFKESTKKLEWKKL